MHMETKEKTFTIISPYGTPSMRECPESMVAEMIAYFNRVIFHTPDHHGLRGLLGCDLPLASCYAVEEETRKSS